MSEWSEDAAACHWAGQRMCARCLEEIMAGGHINGNDFFGTVLFSSCSGGEICDPCGRAYGSSVCMAALDRLLTLVGMIHDLRHGLPLWSDAGPGRLN